MINILSINKEIKVNIKENSNTYSILIDENLMSDIKEIISKQYKGEKLFIVTDENVYNLYGEELKSRLKSKFKTIFYVVPPGEKAKSFKYLKKGYDKLVQQNFHRDNLVIGFGGGVVGDLAGYLAASYMRGIKLIQIPTSLLAQVDSSVGGKTAINHEKGKNLIGAFYQPDQVIIDVEFLKTLPLRELKTGLAEVIKHSLIKKADNFYKYLYENKNDIFDLKNKTLIDIIKISCRIKADVVMKDEKEKGLRAILNFGHTIGHALESYYEYDKYTHGEAVAIGMRGAAKLSFKLGLTPLSQLKKVEEIIDIYKLPQNIQLQDINKLYENMKYDKKAKNDTLRWILLEEIGKPVIKSNLNKKIILEVLEELQCEK